MGKINSQIWCLRSERLGSLQAFRSERDMESFLMNNPAIIVGWEPEKSERFPLLEQTALMKGDKQAGRIDIVGLAKTEDGFELRFFELKNEQVTIDAVAQVNSYISHWYSDESKKKEIRDWIESMHYSELTSKKIDSILDNPVGVVVGPSFAPDAITK